MLDPKRDLAGATPEKLARALLRPLRPRAEGQAVVPNKVTVEKVATDQARATLNGEYAGPGRSGLG